AQEIIRPYASHGARGLLEIGLELTPDNPDFGAARLEFLVFTNAISATAPGFFPASPNCWTGWKAGASPGGW
ncbi:MAG: phosphoglycolate phosphatase, partial [Chloroflexota bacterium]